MHIIHVIDSLDPAKGGPPHVAMNLAAAQTALGHTVSILCNDHSDRAKDIASARAVIPGAEHFHVLDTCRPGSVENLTGTRTAVQLRPLLRADSFVHLHGLWEPRLWRAAQLARRVGVGYAVRTLSLLHPWQMERYVWQKRIVLALGAQRMLDQASFIHALNKEEAVFVSDYASRTPIDIIPNGVFLEQFEPIPSAGAFHARHPELGGRPYILFLSRLHHQKGLTVLAEAFNHLAKKDANVSLVVAGPDQGERHTFCARIEEAGLRSRVHMVGPLYGAEKTEALRDALCYCLPSLNEGFSVALLEALAMGLPSVISERCFFPEVQEVGAGVVVPLDPPLIAAALLRILRDQPLRESMSKAARRLIAGSYIWPRIAEQTVAAYQRHLPRGIG